MTYEITCKNSNDELLTLTIQDTEKIKISMEDGEFGNFILFRNEFNQVSEQSSDMANIFNFFSKNNKEYTISININSNNFIFTTFDSIRNVKFTTNVNEEKDNFATVFSSTIQVTL